MTAAGGDVPEELGRIAANGREVILRTAVPADREALLDCFNSVFPVDDPSVPRMSAATWDWKFDPFYSGRREIVLAEEPAAGGRILGAYPSQAMRVWLDGEERHTAQIVDLMVRHEERRFGPRPGIFVKMGEAYYSRFCGAGSGRQPFNYGWPVPAWRMGQRYLRYMNVRDWNPIAGPVPFDPRPRSEQLVVSVVDPETAESDGFRADADRLWERLRAAERLALVRDARWWIWRYVRHPEKEYRLLECRERSSGELRAIGVDHIGDTFRPQTCFLIDWLVAREDQDAIVALVAEVEDRARLAKTGVMATVLNIADPRCLPVQRLGYQVWNSDYFVVVASFGPDTGMLREHWHFTMGESDLV